MSPSKRKTEASDEEESKKIKVHDSSELKTKICKDLDESNDHMIGLVVDQLGFPASTELFGKALEMHQSEEGVLLADGSGKKTAGGIFFQLARDSMGRSDFNRLSKLNCKHRRSVKKSKSDTEETKESNEN